VVREVEHHLLKAAGAFLAVITGVAAAEGDVPVEAHVQATYVRQLKPEFSAAYSGPKSLVAERAYGYSFTATAFFGVRLGDGWEAYWNPEVTQGVPLSELHGLGGFSNGETQRTAGPTLTGYNARAYVRKTWNVSGEYEERASDANQVRTRYASERVVATVGTVSVLDIFDVLDHSHDPRTQFLNWASLTYGAWDYPRNRTG
jgi:high affinity Mn2+ porin